MELIIIEFFVTRICWWVNLFFLDIDEAKFQILSIWGLWMSNLYLWSVIGPLWIWGYIKTVEKMLKV